MTCSTLPGPPRDTYDTIVRSALARQLGREPDAIAPSDRLREDLGLDAFDLSVVALRLERQHKREFPLAILDLVQKVEQLAALVRAWATGRRPNTAV